METPRKLTFEIVSSNDSFGAYCDDCEGIWGAGNTIEEAKKDVYEAIRLLKEELPYRQWPEVLKGEYVIDWHYDVQALLKHYQGIFSHAALERLTGINQKQLWNYANGASKPRPQSRKKIESALHTLGSELMAISL